MKNKFSVMFSRYPYGAKEHPAGTDWLINSIHTAATMPLVGRVDTRWILGTPITMLRNRSILYCIENEYDVLVMLDNDNIPDRDFFERAFHFYYANYEDFPSVIASPYCGPPPYENVYVFQWERYGNDSPDDPHKLLGMNRNEVEHMTGIKPAVAVPTGCIFVDMRIFTGFGGITLPPPWFFYEYEDEFQTKVKSTEDVVWSRNVSVLFKTVLGLDVVYVDWDSWAIHIKTKAVEKPNTQYPTNIKALFDRYFENKIGQA